MRTILPKNTLVVIAALFTLMFALPQKAMAQTKEAYAVRDNAGTITFYYDAQKATRTGTIANIQDGYFITQAWIESPETYNPTGITTAVFDASFAGYAPTSLYKWFKGMSALTTVKGMEYLNTANVATMEFMFENCSALQAVDMSHCNTDKLINIASMFDCCSALQTLDLTTFHGEALLDMNCAFFNCTELTTIYCNNTWTCSISTSMFANCTKLKGAVAFDPAKDNAAMANPETGYFTRKIVDGIDTPTVNASQKKQGTYNLAGQRVGDSYKGIVIENGRKVVRK